MSNRRNAFEGKSSNPAKYFLEWKSNDKCFAYYDKEKKESLSLPLPVSFLVLEELSVIKGWNDASESGITSNEVKYIGHEPVTVRSFKGGEIAVGIYKDVKQKVNEAGGVFHKSLYVMNNEGEILNVSFKGAVVKAWGDFLKTKEDRENLLDRLVSVKTSLQGKKGSVTYNVPVFEFGDEVTEDQSILADDCYDVVESYLGLNKDPLKEVEKPEDASADPLGNDYQDIPI